MSNPENQTDVPSEPSTNRLSVNSALYCMAMVSRQLGQRLTISELKQRFNHLPVIDQTELIRCFQEVDFKAQWVELTRKSISDLPLPGIIFFEDQFVCLNQVSSETAQIQKLGESRAIETSVDEILEKSSGQVLLVNPSEKAESSTMQEFGFGWFIKTIFKYRSVMRETLLASFFIQLFALVTPLFFMIIIDKVFSHNNLSTLDVLVFAMVVVAIFDVILNGVRTYLMSHTTNRVDMELGMQLFKHMMRLPLSYFESRRTGDTIARMREMETVRHFLTGSTLTLLIDLLFLVIFLIVMYLFSPLLAAIVVATLPLFFLVSYLMTPLMKSKLEDKHLISAENQSFLVEMIGGMETVKSGSVEAHQQREWENRLARLAKCSFNSSNLANLINQSTSLISKILTVALLYIGAKLVLAGDLSVGQLIAFNMLTARVIQPIQRLAQIWQEFTSTRISIKRLADILEAPTEPVMLKGKTQLPRLKGGVEFDRVSFSYKKDAQPVLHDISFKVRAGEIIGIVGSTGSGKTTMIKLLQRLYVPTSGRILIDGINLVSADGSNLRKQIGVVAQDFVLFNKTIRENITLSDANIDDTEVIAAAEMVGAHEMIMQLPEGYDTELNERGRGLSTGQRQAIALARALVTDPSVLILDEATSALDYESEQRFQENFKAISAGRTTFVVAHRLSTVRHADRIMTLENGRIIEDAAPDKLLKSGGRFADLHKIHQQTWLEDDGVIQEAANV